MFGFYNEWNEENVRDWQLKRKKGALMFCLIHGVLRWGAIMFLAIFVGKHLVNFTIGNTIDFNQLTFDLCFGSMFSVIAGAIYGWSIWRNTEKQCNSRMSNKNA